MNQEKEIPAALMMAAEDTVSTFLIETGEIKNNKKIMEYSFLINAFIHFSDDLKSKLDESNNVSDMKNISSYIYSIIERNYESYLFFDDYSELIGASYILAIDECLEHLENFKEEEIHRNLILHFLTIIPLQNIINNGENNEH